MVKEENLGLLDEYFSENDLEWRFASSGVTKDGKPYAKVLVYVTSRAIQNRLDSVCGKDGWKTEIKQLSSGAYICTLSILVQRKNGEVEWVSKEDGSDATNIEAVKGGISGSVKRAAVQWGIGRYLYDFGESWAEFIQKDGKWASKGGKYSTQIKASGNAYFAWNPPKLPSWAIPMTDAQKKELKELVIAVQEYDSAGYIPSSYQQKVDMYIADKDIEGLKKVVEYCKSKKETK